MVVALLWIVAALNYLDRIMITTMRWSLVESIPMTDAQFGLLTSVFLWSYGILSPFAGFLADRFSRSRVVILSLLAWSVLTWLTGHAKTFDQLLIVRTLMGISEACYIPAGLALIADYHRGHTRSLATGVHMTGVFTGSALGGMGGWLAEKHTWGYAFSFFGVIGIVYGLFLLFVLKDPPKQEQPSGSEPAKPVAFGAALKSLFSNGSFLLILAFWGLIGLVGWALVGWLPTYLGEQFNLGQGAAGMSATGYLQTASMVGVLLGGFLADRLSRKYRRGRILVPVVGLCVAAPAIFMAASTSLLPLAVAGLIIYGLTRAFTDANMMPILCLVSDPRYRATGYGVLNLFACIIGGLTIYAGGALRDQAVNLSVLFQVAAVTLLICAAILFLVKPSVAETPER
jgi:MFS family permease